MKVPGAERAQIDAAKVRDYLLSPEHPIGRAKARFFTNLGFDREGWEALRDALRAHLRNDAEGTDQSPFGQKYVVRGMIQGPTGTSARVVTVWIVLAHEDFPRFVTAYPDEVRP